MLFRQFRNITTAVYALYADSGFAMAGAVAFSFVLSLFPFCIFLGAVAGLFGGEAFAQQGITRLFEIVPAPVAEALAPEVMAVMGRSRFDLLTVGALISLFFATSAIESLRAALNIAYRQKESRPYYMCLLESSGFVILSAVGMLVLTWGVVVGPEIAARIKPAWLLWLADEGWLAFAVRFAIVITAIGLQLVAYHLWLAAGRRRLADSRGLAFGGGRGIVQLFDHRDHAPEKPVDISRVAQPGEHPVEDIEHLLVSARDGMVQSEHANDVGFRCVLKLKPVGAPGSAKKKKGG
jgi:membrane protein